MSADATTDADRAEQAVRTLLVTWSTLTPAQRDRIPVALRREILDLAHWRRKAGLPPTGYRFVPVEAAAVSGPGGQITDEEWIEVPGRGLLFEDLEPQCSARYDLPSRLETVRARYRTAEIVHVPVVFLGSCHAWLGMGPKA